MFRSLYEAAINDTKVVTHARSPFMTASSPAALRSAATSSASAAASGTGTGWLHTSGSKIVDSTGAVVLIKLVKDIREYGATSVAYGANQDVAELIVLLGMDEFVMLLPDERSALSALQ